MEPQRISFGDFTLDVGRRLLLRGAIDIHLSPKAFDLLALLLQQRPRAVSKEEILKRLWPGTFVTENNIATLVADLRAAIEDDARNARFIRTVHGFGYAFAGAALDERAIEPGPDRLPSRWTLVWEHRAIPLLWGENILGRSGERVLVLDSPSVSRRHARVIVTGDEASVEDLGSKNGTWLGADPVTGPVPVRDGDRLRLGSVLLTVRLNCESTSTETIVLTPA